MKNSIILIFVAMLALTACTSSKADSSSEPNTPASSITASSSVPEAASSSESTPESTSSASSADPAPETESKEYKSGTYKVGTDLPADTYFVKADKGSIVSSFTVKNGSSADATVLAVDMVTTHSIIRVEEGEYITVDGATLMSMDSSKDIAAGMDGKISEGMYLVGFHIPAGEYKTIVNESAIVPSFTIFGDADQTNVKDVQMLSGDGYITVKDGEFIKLSGIHLEKA